MGSIVRAYLKTRSKSEIKVELKFLISLYALLKFTNLDYTYLNKIKPYIKLSKRFFLLPF